VLKVLSIPEYAALLRRDTIPGFEIGMGEPTQKTRLEESTENPEDIEDLEDLIPDFLDPDPTLPPWTPET
jgi:hypothetical protein